MKLKLPFKLKVKYLNANEDSFQGKAVFHEKVHPIKIHAQNNEKSIKVPFSVIGIKSRISLGFFFGEMSKNHLCSWT